MRELQVSTCAGALTTQRVHSVSLLKSDCLNNGCLVVVWIFERLIGTRGCRGIVHSHLIQFLASPHGSSRFSFLPLIYIYHARGPAGFALSPFPVFQLPHHCTDRCLFICSPSVVQVLLAGEFLWYCMIVTNATAKRTRYNRKDQFRALMIACRGGNSCPNGVQSAPSQGYVPVAWYTLPVLVHVTFYMLLFSVFP
jgi:hypothetical protein